MRRILLRESGSVAIIEGPNAKHLELTFTLPGGKFDKIVEEFSGSLIPEQDWKELLNNKDRKLVHLKKVSKHLISTYKRGVNLNEDNRRDAIDNKFKK